MGTVLFILLGYLSGSVLYARIFARLFGKENIIENSKDKNPGTANAFQYGGFWCGCMTLICDVLKGFFPVYAYLRCVPQLRPGALAVSFVLAAPAAGHAFPVFYRFKGGKGIAVTFGSLLGLLPTWRPFIMLAAFFIFFSAVLRITPHFYRTLAAYFCSLFCMACSAECHSILIGFLIITAVLCVRMSASPEEREKPQVRLLWMH